MSMIDKLPALPQMFPKLQETPQKAATEKSPSSFGDTLKKFVSDVNEMQVESADKQMKFATGEIKDVHEVMASAEEASISLMLLMELRNKAVDAYKELMRTPV
jgi:flagellar hook-basal body complex protein FliE